MKLDKTTYAVVFFEGFLRRDQPDLWKYLQENYAPQKQLPGRVSPATIYVRKSAPTAQP